MSAADLAVENALGAEDVGDFCVRRSGEFAGPLAGGSDAAQIILFYLLAFFDLFLLLGSGLGEFAFDAELGLDSWVLAFADVELLTECNFIAGRFSCCRFAG